MVGSNRAYWGHEFDISGSRDVIGQVIIRLAIVHFLLVVIYSFATFGTKPPSLTVSEILNSECDAMVNMTLNDF